MSYLFWGVLFSGKQEIGTIQVENSESSIATLEKVVALMVKVVLTRTVAEKIVGSELSGPMNEPSHLVWWALKKSWSLIEESVGGECFIIRRWDVSRYE